MAEQTGWVEPATASAGVATATKVADVNRQHIIHSVDASAVGAAEILLLQIRDDTDVIWEGHVHQQREVLFPKGLSITKGNACSAVLTAGAGITKVNLHGASR